MALRWWSAALVLLVAWPGLRSCAAQASWEDELGETDYFVGQLSLINLVNGLNLTRDQAVRLRALAVRVEAVAVRPPALTVKLSPDISRVRKAYMELSETLLKGQAVAPELERRVLEARAIQSRFTRSTLRPKPQAHTLRCSDCHQDPRKAKPGDEPMAITPGLKIEMDLGHALGDYGREGLGALAKASPEVEKILSDEQKAILGSFTCCLLPPADLSDPVRAGQAAFSGKEMDLLRLARKIPEAQWPAARQEILTKVDLVTELVSPGATAQAKAGARTQLGEALDRVRGLSEVAFELEKSELARSAKEATQPPSPDSPHKAAYFLLFPGASKVYASYLKRLDEPPRAEPLH